MYMAKNKYYILTFGCQMNVYDSEALAGYMEKLGYTEAVSPEEAEVLILNTCAVRKKAEDKVFSRLGTIRELKRNNPRMTVILWGCMAASQETALLLKERFKFIDLIAGPNSLGRFPDLLEKAQSSRGTITDPDLTGARESLPVKRTDGFKAWVPISHGCNNFCSYCIVPYARGPEVSRRPGDVIRDVEELIRGGYKEITLLGQNVNSYGKDLQEGTDFAGLLRFIDAMSESLRIRFMTSHPRDLSAGVIRAIDEGKNICEHIHLPLQSGSDHILKEMNRGYSRDYYLGLIKMIRAALPGAAVTTDIIVGFPGEDDSDFNKTMEIMEKVRFDAAYTFVYSPRQGTAAAKMENQVSAVIKQNRIIQLNKLQNRIVQEKNELLKGALQEVLVEGRSKTDENMFTGRTRTNKIVHFPSETDLTGKLATVEILEARAWSLRGQLTMHNA